MHYPLCRHLNDEPRPYPHPSPYLIYPGIPEDRRILVGTLEGKDEGERIGSVSGIGRSVTRWRPEGMDPLRRGLSTGSTPVDPVWSPVDLGLSRGLSGKNFPPSTVK